MKLLKLKAKRKPLKQKQTTRIDTNIPDEAHRSNREGSDVSIHDEVVIYDPATWFPKPDRHFQEQANSKEDLNSIQKRPNDNVAPHSINKRFKEEGPRREHRSLNAHQPVVDSKSRALGHAGEVRTTNSRFLASSHVEGGLWSWIPHVTQSADDSSVINRVKDVFVSAEQFVNNFYLDNPYTGNISNEALELANASQLLTTSQLQEWLIAANYHTSLIKHTLVSLLLSLISFDSVTSQRSLLPKEFQNFNVLARAVMNSKASDDGVLHMQPALSSYRVLSGYIRSDVQDDDNYLQERRHIIEDVTSMFETVFRHWVNRDKKQADLRNVLGQVLQKAGTLGVFLFCQPAVFLFDWQMVSEDLHGYAIPVWPRLLRVFDSEAQFREIADHLIPMKHDIVFKERYIELNASLEATKLNSNTKNDVAIIGATNSSSEEDSNIQSGQPVDFFSEPSTPAKSSSASSHSLPNTFQLGFRKTHLPFRSTSPGQDTYGSQCITPIQNPLTVDKQMTVPPAQIKKPQYQPKKDRLVEDSDFTNPDKARHELLEGIAEEDHNSTVHDCSQLDVVTELEGQ